MAGCLQFYPARYQTNQDSESRLIKTRATPGKPIKFSRCFAFPFTKQTSPTASSSFETLVLCKEAPIKFRLSLHKTLYWADKKARAKKSFSGERTQRLTWAIDKRVEGVELEAIIGGVGRRLFYKYRRVSLLTMFSLFSVRQGGSLRKKLFLCPRLLTNSWSQPPPHVLVLDKSSDERERKKFTNLFGCHGVV